MSTKKHKTQASDVEVGGRTLEAILLDLAERSTRAEERSATAEERSATAEEKATIALQTIAAVSQDLRAITQELREANRRTDARLDALEKGSLGAGR